MGIFFKTPKHRVFEYKPLYYDPRKEALDEKLSNSANVMQVSMYLVIM